jgi:hypothetical protein
MGVRQTIIWIPLNLGIAGNEAANLRARQAGHIG